MTKVSMVVAAAEDNAIGKHNDLLWHLPDDFKFFKDTTIGHPIVMGRKTFQALGKALPKRLNIVITRQSDFEAPGAEVVGDIDSALIMARDTGTDEIMVIGGAEIYRQALPETNRVYLTRVHASFPDADAHFPVLSPDEWTLVSTALHDSDERHKYAFTFEVWDRVEL
jgi:dihydrofolate reductase